jgi:hypothetical protein
MGRAAAMSEIKPGDRVRFLSRACGNHKWITGTVVEDARTDELRVAILPDRGQTDAGGSYVSAKVPRFRYPSQVQKLIK